MTERSLYELDLSQVEFSRACGGNQGGGDDGTETCLMLGAVPDAPGVFALGDSKRPDRLPFLFTAEELQRAGIDPVRFGLSA